MRDITPLSARFDLRYIRKRHYPDTWTRVASVVVFLGLAAYVAAREWSGDSTLFSAGPLTNAHAIFAHDCAQCHQPSSGADAPAQGRLAVASGRYWLPAQDSACLRCHTAAQHNPHQSRFSGAAIAPRGREDTIVMAGECSTCHVEHRGARADLKALTDSTCVQCHQNLSVNGRLMLLTIPRAAVDAAQRPPAPAPKPADAPSGGAR